MKLGDFEVTVLANGILHEIQHDDRIYVVAKPGESYSICVRRGNDDHGEFVQAEVLVDGIDVGIAHLLEKNNTRYFQGFHLPGEEGEPPREATFKFAERPSSTGEAAPAPQQHQPGTIEVRIYETARAGEQRASWLGWFGMGKASAFSKSAPSMKDSKQGKLCTQAGSVMTYPWGLSNTSINKVGDPIVNGVLHYETATTLMLRHVLDLNVSQHQAILMEYGDEGTKQLLSGPAPEAAPASRKRRAQASAPAAAPPAAGTDTVRMTRSRAKLIASAATTTSDQQPGSQARRKRAASKGKNSSRGTEAAQPDNHAAQCEQQASAPVPARQQRKRRAAAARAGSSQQVTAAAGAPVVAVKQEQLELARPAQMPATQIDGREVARGEIVHCDLCSGSSSDDDGVNHDGKQQQEQQQGEPEQAGAGAQQRKQLGRWHVEKVPVYEVDGDDDAGDEGGSRWGVGWVGRLFKRLRRW